ncbi:MAG: hypothetical protein M3014_07975 [Chloroflexota bacterium]|nr:hypothetical protein [Chloroflexota bacterium]
MADLNTNKPSDPDVATGKLRDGWTYRIERIPIKNSFRVTVLHPYGDALSGGVPWPIEDPSLDVDPSYPTYPTVEEAISAAEGYLDRLSEVWGYPDPEKMSARGLRPALW